MLHEIINPSDKYYVECDDLAVLTASIFLLGNGLYSTKSKETEYSVPMTAFNEVNAVDFFKNEFDLDLKSFVNDKNIEISECLGNITIGDLNVRKNFLEKIQIIKEEKEKEKFILKWFDKYQTSMNQIGQRAYYLSKMLKNKTKSWN